ncbi:MAG: molybdopterin-dependent oxidoreductase [Bacteroidales bacterium]|jgi:xanthine dehydrogenase large subunit|nr:molybdopterin-dependent oxidoreductase [Bacteroidales bacterium]
MKNPEAANHSTGRSQYLDDIPALKNTLYGVIFGSPSAHGRIISLDISGALAATGVNAVFTKSDIPGKNDIGGIIPDETLFADEEVHYLGQPVALVVADSEYAARKAAKLIRVSIEELEPVTDPRVAKEKGHLLIPSRTFRMGDVAAAWNECDIVIEGRADCGAQEHLYLETQGAYSWPGDNGAIIIHSSTQSPTLVQKVAARVLALPMNMVEVDVARLGGAFGGKEDQATFVAVMTALAASLLQRPVKITLSRGDDMRMTGKRHPYSADFRIGLTNDYRIKAYSAVLYQNGGAAADLSPAIMERTLFHSTNAYFIPNTEVTVHSCRTNIPPNTAFRGFGAPQGMFVIESAIAKAAAELKVPARIIQQANFLKENDVFQYGQVALDVNIGECFAKLDGEFRIEEIEKEIAEFNSRGTIYRKGMALMPVCFGISFTKTSMNHARALVHIYQDGSIGISTGAVEMGQGVNAKLARVAAGTFSVNPARIKIETTNTTRVANTSPTAASSGADLNGNALLIACNKLAGRLKEAAASLLGCSADEIRLSDEKVLRNGEPTGITWEKLIPEAFLMRIALSENGHYATPVIFFDKSVEKGHPFAYHVYGTAVVTVLLDCLRGTYRTERVLVVHDFGNNINPDIDMGQMEGGVMQGIGWMTMEEVLFDNRGRMLTDSLSTYKVPDIYSAPETSEIRALEKEGPGLALMKSKAIGEPPFMYGIGAYFALQNAISSFNPSWRPDYNAPMTPEKVLMRLYDKK